MRMKCMILTATCAVILAGTSCGRHNADEKVLVNGNIRRDTISPWQDSIEWKSDSLVGKFRVYEYDTPNIAEGKNGVKGVVLHHTATADAKEAFSKLTTPGSGVSCHVLIDNDGTRYVVADPEKITWHAGRSRFKGKDGANNFTIGIEFQGNTVDNPLTPLQIESAVEYLLPIMNEYGLSADDVTTHEKIRADWKKANPDTDTPDKVDVTSTEHQRLVSALRKQLR